MIGTMKCAEFSKFMDYYKKKTHLSFYDYQNFMYATTMQFEQPLKMNAYEEWQNEHEVLNMVAPEKIEVQKMDVEKQYVTIDFSLNTISDLIKIAEQNPVNEDVEYNINLKTIHVIKPELCELDAMVGMNNLKKS